MNAYSPEAIAINAIHDAISYPFSTPAELSSATDGLSRDSIESLWVKSGEIAWDDNGNVCFGLIGDAEEAPYVAWDEDGRVFVDGE